MRLFNKVAIVGVGLIGGSIGLAMKKKKLAGTVIGISRHKETLDNALRLHAIDKGSRDIREIAGADMVILAAPVETIIKLAPGISTLIKPSCIVTDVGSTKLEIVSRLDKAFSHYIGAHPLAGSEKRSVLFARGDMFQRSLCILTPTPRSSKEAFLKVRKLWAAMGARVAVISPQLHDKALALVSHLPHVAAFSLIKSIPVNYLKFSGSGLRDTTRIAASDSSLWADILLSNRANILKAIDAMQDNLSGIRKAISKGNRQQLHSILSQAGKKRRILNGKGKCKLITTLACQNSKPVQAAKIAASHRRGRFS